MRRLRLKAASALSKLQDAQSSNKQSKFKLSAVLSDGASHGTGTPTAKGVSEGPQKPTNACALCAWGLPARRRRRTGRRRWHLRGADREARSGRVIFFVTTTNNNNQESRERESLLPPRSWHLQPPQPLGRQHLQAPTAPASATTVERCLRPQGRLGLKRAAASRSAPLQSGWG